MPLRRSIILYLLVSLLLLLPAGARGQQNLTLENLTVSFWPEFDQPAVLVIYQAQLPADTPLPASVELPLPEGVDEPHAVANATEAGALVNADYNILEDQSIIQVNAETRTVWLEYYQDLNFDGQARRFSYRWPGTVAVDQFTYEVQRPTGAQSLELDPPAESQRQGPDGLTYLTGSFGPVAAGEERSLTMSYQKETDELTAGVPPQLPAEGVSATPPATQEDPGWLVPALIGLAVALAIAFGYFLWRRQQRPKPRRRRARRRTPTKEEATRYCHSCGQQVSPTDRFCRHCGAEQRPV